MNETFGLGLQIVGIFAIPFVLLIIYFSLIHGNEGEAIFFIIILAIFVGFVYGVGYVAKLIIPYLNEFFPVIKGYVPWTT